jgi:hypothetical protein
MEAVVVLLLRPKSTLPAQLQPSLCFCASV